MRRYSALNVVRKALLLVLCCFAMHAGAFTPAQGFWYNNNESGRGFNIDIQDNVMAVASYVYTSSGTPIWYTSAGLYRESTSTFTATFDASTGGQCLGCVYTPPTRSSGAGGAIQIVFSDPENAVLYFQGGSTPIHHFVYGYASKNAYLRGAWQLSIDTLGLIDGQWLLFPGTTYTGSDGTVYESGYEESRSTSTAALGVWVPSLNIFLIVIDDGTGYVLTYAVNGDDNRMAGHGWVEPKGTSISGNGSPAATARILTLSELNGTGKALHGSSASPERLASLEPILRQRMAQLQASANAN